MQKCDICATVGPMSTKFNEIMQNVYLKWLAVKNFNFKIQRRQTTVVLKIDKLQYRMMMQKGCQAYRLSAILDF